MINLIFIYLIFKVINLIWWCEIIIWIGFLHNFWDVNFLLFVFVIFFIIICEIKSCFFLDLNKVFKLLFIIPSSLNKELKERSLFSLLILFKSLLELLWKLFDELWVSLIILLVLLLDLYKYL